MMSVSMRLEALVGSGYGWLWWCLATVSRGHRYCSPEAIGILAAQMSCHGGIPPLRAHRLHRGVELK